MSAVPWDLQRAWRRCLFCAQPKFGDQQLLSAPGVTDVYSGNLKTDQFVRSDRLQGRMMSVRLLRRTGFTLIELIVSIAIVGVLAALLIPAVQSSRDAARRTVCKNQLRQLGLALHMYHDVHRCFPPGSYTMGPSFPMQSGWGWGAMALPYIEQNAVYEQIDFGLGTGLGGNLPLIALPIPAFRCPSEIGSDTIGCVPTGSSPFQLASGNYCGSEGVLSAMSAVRIAQITDGTSQTLMLGERIVQPGGPTSLPFTSAWCGQVAFADEYDLRSVPYLLPDPNHPLNGSSTDPLCFGSRHQQGANFVLVDGSCVFLNDGIDPQVFTALGTPNGGEFVNVEAP
jgi:prepilin-type N-terminal cleavage/methylation domain-containing protein/prepilin-type processing-associated H-X9-DG protein